MTEAPRTRRRRRALRGAEPLLVAGGLALLFFVALTLHRFFASDETPRRGPRRSLYLDGERRTLGAGGSGEGAAGRGGGPSAPVRPRSGRSGEGASGGGARRWAPQGDGIEGEKAVHIELRDVVASEDVIVRVLGTPDGDYIYHKGHGWMRYGSGSWQTVRVDEVPEVLLRLYPSLTGDPSRCQGDGDFGSASWAKVVVGKERVP